MRVCSCDAAAPEGTFWGGDAYTADGDICTAARHGGAPKDCWPHPRHAQGRRVLRPDFHPGARGGRCAASLAAPLAQAGNATRPGRSLRWLVGQRRDAGRLAADGKGPDEPIADNATDGGRAVNRRTQSIRLWRRSKPIAAPPAFAPGAR